MTLDRDRLEPLRQRSQNQENLLQIMVDLFLADAPERLDSMKAAVATGDADTVARNAHNLNGAAGSVGAMRMVSLCRRLEQPARRGDLSGAPFLIERLESEFELVATALRAEVASE